MTDFTYAVHDDGVAVLTWDVPGKSMNVLTREAFELVEGFIDEALADDAVKGIVITSGKESFAGGMDLNVLGNIRAQSGDDPAPAGEPAPRGADCTVRATSVSGRIEVTP